MTDQPRPSGAVFLSYASQDAEAATRICESLRAAGVEVWLDKSELRGGDAWDSQIKKQIHDCALFVPLISAHTNARSEGYFRREWKQAIRRLQDMADDVAFLVPVVVDDTREADARVPEEFFQAHWTWLPGGETPPAFAQRVRQLLGLDPAAAPKVKAGATAVLEPSERRHGSAWPRGTPLMRRIGLPLIAVLLVMGGGALWYFQGVGDIPAAMPSTAITAPNEKSIAVLPFVNISSDKEQEYFADGLSEELLNLLAKIPELQVAARTSSFYYKGKEVKLAEIARELNVAHVLEGSVRKSGNQLRITAQLIRAADGYHQWSETYDRTQEDVFAIQEEIAEAVVKQLKVTLLGAAPKVQKTNPEAYALFLEARNLYRQYTLQGIEQSIALYQQALAIDPSYAAAWNGLAEQYMEQAYLGLDTRSADEGYRLAREAANKALAVDPEYALPHANLSQIARQYDDDLAAAVRHMEQALALDPADLYTLRQAASLCLGLGRLNTAIEVMEYVVARDPMDPANHFYLGWFYSRAGRLDEAITSIRTGLKLSPDSIETHYDIGAAMVRKGDNEAALAAMLEEPEEGWRLTGLALAYHALGQASASDAALAELIKNHEKSWSSNIAWVFAFRGEADRAFEWLDKAVAYHDTGVVNFANEPLLSNLHDDPRWLPFLRKLGKTPEQLAAIKFEVKLPR
jgi:TolB-like protein/Tfp pilus assembly protein PilF